MNEKIMRDAGFGEEMDLVNQSKCPMCKEKIDFDDFKNDVLSLKEFTISGMCMKCQTEIFGEHNE